MYDVIKFQSVKGTTSAYCMCVLLVRTSSRTPGKNANLVCTVTALQPYLHLHTHTKEYGLHICPRSAAPLSTFCRIPRHTDRKHHCSHSSL